MFLKLVDIFFSKDAHACMNSLKRYVLSKWVKPIRAAAIAEDRK